MIDPELLRLLVCPIPECRSALEEVDEGLRCRRCGTVYSTSSGWPNLIPEEARHAGATRQPGTGARAEQPPDTSDA